MKKPVTAVFDIGKTNKKFFLFDTELKEVFQTYTRFDPVPDEDGFPSEAILKVRDWMLQTFQKALESQEHEIIQLNFSAHGASFVHVDEDGEPVTPLYDYLKPFPPDLLERFYIENEGKETFCRKTSSPALAMLNSGLQLYFIKHNKPDLFEKIRYSLHLPQYCSFVFTGKMVSDYTSIGCHTGLWEFGRDDYHNWVKREGIEALLPPIIKGDRILRTKASLGNIPCGIGIHDSSSALLPYLKMEKEPFALLSTGTWAISINPFNKLPLSKIQLDRDCLQFLSISGQPIKISRLFIGEEHKFQIEKMYTHWALPLGTYKKLSLDSEKLKETMNTNKKYFHFEYLKPEIYQLDQAEKTDLSLFSDFESAYYQFIHELTDLQVTSLELVVDEAPVRRLYVDGGFNANPIFLAFLKAKLSEIEIIPSDFPNGSALGAALLVKSTVETGK